MLNSKQMSMKFVLVMDFNFCILMDSSFWFDTINLGYSICTYLGVFGYNFHKNIVFFCLKIFFTFTNSVDPDEMLHSLKKYSFRGFRKQRAKMPTITGI